MQFMLRGPAAEYLSSRIKGLRITATALANMASRGKGPQYHVINGRACYTPDALDRWIAEQAARPVTESHRGRRAERHAQSAP
ncbi:MAG: hypothetical protein IRZ28_18035 [Steroidobacteraceae bacterium]|nr:hypothetical protein [Steroidobacteraceae bacterium]